MGKLNIQELPTSLYKQLVIKINQNIPTQGREDLIKWALDNWQSDVNGLSILSKLIKHPLHDYWGSFYEYFFSIMVDLDVYIPTYDDKDYSFPFIIPASLTTDILLAKYKEVLAKMHKPLLLVNNLENEIKAGKWQLRKSESSYAFWMNNENGLLKFVDKYADIKKGPSLFDLILIDLHAMLVKNRQSSLYDQSYVMNEGYRMNFFSTQSIINKKDNYDVTYSICIYVENGKLYIDKERLFIVDDMNRVIKLKY